jgi:hypothetical protein
MGRDRPRGRWDLAWSNHLQKRVNVCLLGTREWKRRPKYIIRADQEAIVSRVLRGRNVYGLGKVWYGLGAAWYGLRAIGYGLDTAWYGLDTAWIQLGTDWIRLGYSLVRFVCDWIRLGYGLVRLGYGLDTAWYGLDTAWIQLGTVCVRLDAAWIQLGTAWIRLGSSLVRFVCDWIRLGYGLVTAWYVLDTALYGLGMAEHFLFFFAFHFLTDWSKMPQRPNGYSELLEILARIPLHHGAARQIAYNTFAKEVNIEPEVIRRFVNKGLSHYCILCLYLSL